LPASRPSIRPELFADAGHVYLRHVSDGCEIWCRCDHGPHGFLSIAAHGHADALAIELRVDGTEIFSDPGTYCYHGEPEWRRYFRSTLGHNTLELLAQDQSVSGGPFLWTKHASSALIKTDGLDQSAPRATWQAEHDGYVERVGPVHRRTVTLDRADQLLTIVDQVIGGSAPSFPARLALHLGLEVDVRLTHVSAQLSWPGGDGVLELPDDLVWSLHRGETNPPLGWYSPAFGEKHPTFTLIGTGNIAEGMELLTRLRIARRREPATR